MSRSALVIGGKRLTNAQLKTELDMHNLAGLKRDYPNQYRTYLKIASMDRLPKADECIRLMQKVDRTYGNGAYGGLLSLAGQHQIIHDGLIDGLARLIRQLGTSNNLEISAGTGKLSYWLNKRGIRITPTDLNPRIRGVKRLDYRDAIDTYRPELVLAAWPVPYGVRLITDVFNRESVRHFIVVGKGGFMARKHWKSILRRAEIIPVEIDAYPSMMDSAINSHENAKELKKVIRKFYRVGRSTQLHQSVLFSAKREDR